MGEELLTRSCKKWVDLFQPPSNETLEEKKDRMKEIHRRKKAEICREKEKEIKRIRETINLEIRVAVFDQLGSRRGDLRIQELADEKAKLYDSFTMEEVMKELNEKERKEKEEEERRKREEEKKLEEVYKK